MICKKFRTVAAFVVLLLFPVLFCTGCSSYRVTVIDPDGQAVSHALLVVREVSMFLPKSLQSASFYRTDDKGCSTIKESPNFDLCCGKIGYWTTCDFEETEKKHITIVLRPATPENAKPGTMFTLYVDDMSEQELYPEWIACLDWQRIRLKELENPLDEEMSSFLKRYWGLQRDGKWNELLDLFSDDARLIDTIHGLTGGIPSKAKLEERLKQLDNEELERVKLSAKMTLQHLKIDSTERTKNWGRIDYHYTVRGAGTYRGTMVLDIRNDRMRISSLETTGPEEEPR